MKFNAEKTKFNTEKENLETQIGELQTEIAIKASRIDYFEETLDDDRKKLQQMIEDKSMVDESSSKPTKKKALMIVDSIYSEKLNDHLKLDKNTDWDIKSYSTMSAALEITKKPKKLLKYHTFVIMIGTSEVVKDERKSDDVVKDILNLCKALMTSKRPVYLLQTPPTYENQHRCYALNHRIGKTNSYDSLTVINIQVLFTLKKSEFIEANSVGLTT